jgi:predicted permease
MHSYQLRESGLITRARKLDKPTLFISITRGNAQALIPLGLVTIGLRGR